jgi:hypothetical protein
MIKSKIEALLEDKMFQLNSKMIWNKNLMIKIYNKIKNLL